MGVGNHSLTLLRKYKEAAQYFMPWMDRERVVKAGYLSGRDINKSEYLGFTFRSAEKSQHTKLVVGAECIFEIIVVKEIKNISREFAPHVLDVIATHGTLTAKEINPIMYLSEKSFATLGEHWEYQR